MSEPAWPSFEEQLSQDRVEQGTALERLIQENQDFDLLRAEEANDKLGLPLWLRVAYRKQHQDQDFPADDPTGGYPRALKNLYAWMLAHPDLQPNPPSNPSATAPETAPAEAAEAEAEVRAAPTAAITIGTEQRISGAQANPRSESDIRVNFFDTNQIIAASNAINDSAQAQFFSQDGGATWGQTSLPLDPSDSFQSDPTVDWTSDGTAWATTIGIDPSFNLRLKSYQSPDAGVTWAFEAIFSDTQTQADKQLMWVDHSPTSPFQDTIYVIWHNGLPAFVNRRLPSTGAWQTPLQVSGAETTGTGIGGDVTTNSAGDVFALWPDTGSRGLFVAKSTDGGASFGTPVPIATTFASFDIGVPAFVFRRALIYVSAGAFRTATQDLVYAIWTDLTGVAGCNTPGNEPGSDATSACKTRIWFSRSVDGGATWEPGRMINDQASLNDQFNPRLSVDETDGTLAVIYYDTVDDPTRLQTDVWTQTSSDDGVTWSAAVKVTSARTDETVAGADFGNQYGDYNGLSGFAGTFHPSWTDRRSGGPEEIWTAPITVTTTPTVQPSSGFAIQGHFGTKGNFEVVAPRQSVRLAHFWRDNDDPNLGWHGPNVFGANAHYHPVALIQSSFSTAGNGPGNLELVAPTGDHLDHYWREDVGPFPWHGPFGIPGASGVEGPALIQGRFGTNGNFEVVAARLAGRLAHFWRDNDATGLPWTGPNVFGANVHYDAVALIQSSFSTAGNGPGNLEVIAHTGDHLDHYWREDVGPFVWHGPFGIPGATGTAATPTLIQGSFGTNGNFEVVVPLASGRLAHFWRDNDDPNLAWHGPNIFGANAVYDAVALIQSNFSTAGNGPGNLEVIAHTGDHLDHYWREDVGPFPWHGPFGIPGTTGTA
jgi:hypothetical protein